MYIIQVVMFIFLFKPFVGYCLYTCVDIIIQVQLFLSAQRVKMHHSSTIQQSPGIQLILSLGFLSSRMTYFFIYLFYIIRYYKNIKLFRFYTLPYLHHALRSYDRL